MKRRKTTEACWENAEIMGIPMIIIHGANRFACLRLIYTEIPRYCTVFQSRQIFSCNLLGKMYAVERWRFSTDFASCSLTGTPIGLFFIEYRIHRLENAISTLRSDNTSDSCSPNLEQNFLARAINRFIKNYVILENVATFVPAYSKQWKVAANCRRWASKNRRRLESHAWK